MDIGLSFNPFLSATTFLGGRDVVRMGLVSKELRRAVVGAWLDFYTSFSADCHLDARALFALSNAEQSYHIVKARMHHGVVTQGGGAELIALSSSKCLRVLDLSHCNGLKHINALGSCAMLEELNLSRCRDLQGLAGLNRCRKLKILNVSHCNGMKDVSALSACSHLEKIVLSFCKSVQTSTFPVTMPVRELVWAGSLLENCKLLTRCSHLRKLNLSASYNLSSIEALSSCSLLQDLDLFCCGRLSSVQGLQCLQSLEVLNLSTCMQLESIWPVCNLAKLTKLNLNRCKKIWDFTPLANCASLLSISLHGCKLAPDADVTSFGSEQCAVSTSANVPLPGSFACLSEAAALSVVHNASFSPSAQLSYSSICSSHEIKLRDLCMALDVAIGILWEDKHGVLCFAGSYVRAEHWKMGQAFVAGSRCCSFRPSCGVPGRALSNGSDWIDDVQQLDLTAFPRQPAAVASGMRTVFAVAVPGGVAEFVSLDVLPRSDAALHEVAVSFESALRR